MLPTTMPDLGTRMSDADRDACERDGFLVIPDALSPEGKPVWWRWHHMVVPGSHRTSRLLDPPRRDEPHPTPLYGLLDGSQPYLVP